MKKAFTMVEMVFVIAIIAILSAVFVPKLLATRDDAQIVKGIKNLNMFISDIGIYYTAKNGFAENPRDMTSVKDIDWFDDESGEILVAGKKCISFFIIPNDGVKPAHLRIEDGSQKSEKICRQILLSDTMKNIKTMRISYNQTHNSRDDKNANYGEIMIGEGSTVRW
ncbi:type II secretion system protein [Campylobacter gastrosuis]|uniref:Type II secretion system GspH family protein n=1 Tax=Campylobacter gastrosuis TaxID=2974576 RepID=A0ABT7HNA9_9BACT|nr:prepilin-type N-terminal cleavage/methylation domain-containing protein [Campylobacter gastrosuis]MDL0087919.1 type II secretion system GspH family protein [Campylobacter gastrosuis]